ncbi:CBS domain-containing protein [Cohnella pontilimi]|uniref:CBS domain-containing protein n=1 Tax=Cohnella pontilimi TaxID=2564100 RepID=A0A4U0F8W2_9BACL|nr:CBS domain-containing protein [Cohnella pontilimi]TJY41127.1 CBS domain-containing protein [Cohnella pontilimi]
MKVKDFMITEVVKVHPETTLRQLLVKLVEHKIGGVPVVDENNRLAGMVSDGDVLRFVKPISAKHNDFFLYYLEWEIHMEEKILSDLEKPVKDCMKRKNLITLSQDDDLEEAVTVLSRHHFKKVPVLDNEQKVVGVISRGDVIRLIVKNWIM